MRPLKGSVCRTSDLLSLHRAEISCATSSLQMANPGIVFLFVDEGQLVCVFVHSILLV